MGTYGTFPKPPGESSPLDYISRAKARGRSVLATRGTWLEMLHFRSFSLPLSRGETYLRIRTNVIYFAMDYGFIVLFIVFLSILWHPISLIVFVVVMFSWLFLYFLRDEPTFLLGLSIYDLHILITQFIYSLAFLLVTGAIMNILISLLIGVVVVLIHAVFRKNDDLFLDEDDLFLDEEAAGPGGRHAAIGEASGPSRRHVDFWRP
ncbi:PRA1 family protein F3-like [Phalaenopsis equestris]|uniref:PRA1 family protein F3-like n=1 Tax=Phalaenopsis equestris TaxID=78828 RepID=UPI0009E4D02F|nr:PRA1 family protein F3-like [Phalaenopsis equestris]